MYPELRLFSSYTGFLKMPISTWVYATKWTESLEQDQNGPPTFGERFYLAMLYYRLGYTPRYHSGV